MSIETLSEAAVKQKRWSEKEQMKEQYWETLRQLNIAVGGELVSELKGRANSGGGVSFTVRRKGLAGLLGLSVRLVVHLDFKLKGEVKYPGLTLFKDDGWIVPNYHISDKESFLLAIEEMR